ncbi:hypothetical protein HYV30_00695 [Candidatus Kaiserbacteria bacterium]|nr:hypothetical protein [Candidatus Kaiserbacteria bacterium]
MPQKQTFSYKDLFSRPHLVSLVTALIMLGTAYIAAHFAYIYAAEYSVRPTTRYVGDLFLDNLPIVDLNFLIIETALIAFVSSIAYMLYHPRSILFSLKALALFVAIRAIFISLTHLGVYPGQLYPGDGFFDSIYVFLNLQSGFFFSGHTGLPFLAAMIFWDHRLARSAFLVLTAVFAVSMLLVRAHYSIDVFAAPFMAYGIFGLTRYLFPRDYALSGAQFVEPSDIPKPE